MASILRHLVPSFGGCLAAACFATLAGAQPAPAPPPAEPVLGPGEDAIKDKPDLLALALAPQPGGLTLEGAAREAVATSSAVRSREVDIEEAEGQTAQTLVQFFPRLTLGASYTRLSEVDSPELGGGGAVLGAATEGPVTVGPCPQNPAAQCVLDAAGLPVGAQAFGFSFPTVLNQFAFTANLTVPISDYFLRSVQAYAAAEHNEKALAMQAEAQRLTVAADAKLAVLNWILAKGQTVALQASVEQAQAELGDAKAVFQVGNASQADVFRIEALVAQAEFSLAEARAVEAVTEHRLRTVLHAKPGRALAIGVDVFHTPPSPPLGTLDDLVGEAVRSRVELQATDEARLAAEEAGSTLDAGYWPRLDAFADAVLANPNPRIVPSQEQFDLTWGVGLRLTWTVNDTFSTLGTSRQARARVARVDAQKAALIDAIRLEVVQAHADVTKAASSMVAAKRGLKAAEETFRVTKQLFAFGKATGTALADAETSVTSARLRKLSAHINQHAATIRLEHATGRDRRAAPEPTPAPAP